MTYFCHHHRTTKWCTNNFDKRNDGDESIESTMVYIRIHAAILAQNMKQVQKNLDQQKKWDN